VTALIRKPALWLVVVSVAVAALTVFGAANYRLYLIHTGSMTPTIPVGSLVIVKKNHDPQLGDVISFRRNGDGAVETHRFIGYASDGMLKTQGDANETPDLGRVS
jgi:signal peptidase